RVGGRAECALPRRRARARRVGGAARARCGGLGGARRGLPGDDHVHGAPHPEPRRAPRRPARLPRGYPARARGRHRLRVGDGGAPDGGAGAQARGRRSLGPALRRPARDRSRESAARALRGAGGPLTLGAPALRQHVVRYDPVRARRDAPPRGPGPGRLGRDDRPRSRLRRRGRAAPMVMRRAEGALEVLDGDVGAADLAATLADVDRLNTWLGGYALSLREIRRLAAGVARERTLRSVDGGGGAAAFAVRLAEWARRSGRAIRVVVVERDGAVLALARPVAAGYPEV